MSITVRRKPLLYVAAALYAIDRQRGGWANRAGNWLVDRCVHVA